MKMISIPFYYEIVRPAAESLFEEAICKITDKNIKEIVEFICDGHYTGELVDIPSHVYDRFVTAANDDFCKKYRDRRRKDVIGDVDDLCLQLYLPQEILNRLPEDVIEKFPEEMFDYDEEELEEGEDSVAEDNNSEFRMEIEDMFFINGRGLDLFGCIESGSISIGDHVKVCGCGKPDVTGIVELITQGRIQCEHAEAPDEVSLLIPNLTRKDCKKGMIVTKLD